MKPKIVELRPDRSLLNPNFEGYKLSLTELSACQKELPAPADRAAPDVGQYSLLHARLFGLHNHMFAEEVHGACHVYFVDKRWRVWKLYLEPFLHRFAEPFLVWQLPERLERVQGEYNVSLKFVRPGLAAFSDGCGVLYLLNTGDPGSDSSWTVSFKNEVLGSGKKFVIQDVLCTENELHLLLLRIDQDVSGEHWMNILSWVVMTFDEDVWVVTATKELQAKGELHYSYLEPECKAVYISSENSFKFAMDGTEEDAPKENKEKKYVWSQTIEDIGIKFKLPENSTKTNLKILTKANEITVQYENSILLSGLLYQSISADLTTWDLKDNFLEILLTKQEEGLMWPELVLGDDNGEFIVDTCIADEVHQKLSHLCADNEANPARGTTFNSQQVEECDFMDEKNFYLERLSWENSEITHRVNLGTNPLILTVKLDELLPPALGLRHDVDVCLWQPFKTIDNEWQLKHKGTLFALGYVQASKQQKKFVACTPDLNYSVICESRRHIFVYCQNKPITNGSLKNRSTGQTVGTIAEQRVISLDNSEILGLHLSNTELYVLTENNMLCYKL